MGVLGHGSADVKMTSLPPWPSWSSTGPRPWVGQPNHLHEQKIKEALTLRTGGQSGQSDHKRFCLDSSSRPKCEGGFNTFGKASISPHSPHHPLMQLMCKKLVKRSGSLNECVKSMSGQVLWLVRTPCSVILSNFNTHQPTENLAGQENINFR